MAKRAAEAPLLREEAFGGVKRAGGLGGIFGSSACTAPSGDAKASNPFMGLSLFSPSSAGGSFFEAAAATLGGGEASGGSGTGAGASASAGFGSFSSGGFAGACGGIFAVGGGFAAVSGGGFGSGGSGFGGGGGTFPASASAPSGTSGVSGDGKANPFMGLSLFSGSASSGATGMFTAAAAGLGAPTTSAGSSVSSSAPAAVAAASSTSPVAASSTGGAKVASSEPEAVEPSLDECKETGEEDEEVVFRAECKLWKLVQQTGPTAAAAPSADAKKDASRPDGGSSQDDGGSGDAAAENGAEAAKTWRWQERGCGIVHINRHSKTGAGRLVMRLRGVGKLLLNTPVFPTTKYERLGQKSVRFMGVDVDVDATAGAVATLCAFRLSLQNGDQQGEFLSVLRDMLNVPAAV